MLSSSPGIKALHILKNNFGVVLKMLKAKSARVNYKVEILITEFLYWTENIENMFFLVNIVSL